MMMMTMLCLSELSKRNIEEDINVSFRFIVHYHVHIIRAYSHFLFLKLFFSKMTCLL